MKKTKLYTSLLSLTFSLQAFSMGLGDMKVFSSLDQPFDAEIELIDVGTVPLSGISANLAPIEEYQHIGIERTFGLNSLNFVVEKNAQGHTVIHIRSVERVSEPFIQLLIDLTWTNGQLFREYDVLLDPPNYQLIANDKIHQISKKHRHRKEKVQTHLSQSTGTESHISINQTSQAPLNVQTYGPCLQGETIWQIAQRYKTPGISMQQLILALVGMNQDAFSQGNLNGLKVGSKLVIPSIPTAGRVPFADAKREVEAHDLAWRLKQPIQHVLFPPYIAPPESPQELVIESRVPSVPILRATLALPKISSYLSAHEDIQSTMQPMASHLQEVGPLLKKQMEMTERAMEAVRDSNMLLKKQLQLIDTQNKKLQDQLKQRDKEIAEMHLKIDLLMKRQGIASQVIPSEETNNHGVWLWVLVLLGVGLGAAYFVRREWFNAQKPVSIDPSPVEPMAPEHKPSAPVIEKVESQSFQDSSLLPEAAIKNEIKETKTEIINEASKAAEVEVVESIAETPIITPQELRFEDDKPEESVPETTKKLLQEKEPSDNLIEFHLDSEDKNMENMQLSIRSRGPEIEPEVPEIEPETPEIEPEVPEVEPEVPEVQPDAPQEIPVRSKAVLDTLLIIAETYLGMGDLVAAQESLQEVIEHGNKKQVTAAKKLMKKLNDKKV